MDITFYTVDVGHGLCQVIRFGERAILIDGGGRLGKRVAEDFLKRYVRVIVAYVATHNDYDHVAAAPELLDHYSSASTLESIWLSLDRPASRPGQSDTDVIPLLGYAKRRKEARTVGALHLLNISDLQPDQPVLVHREVAADAELQLLYPRLLDITSSIIRGQPDSVATNAASAILRLVVGSDKARAAVLITGDATCQSFRVAHETYGFDLQARVLAVPHHGGEIPVESGAETWDTVVEWVAPEIAVVSAGHGTVPRPTTTKRETFDSLRRRKVNICCTEITEHCHPGFKGFSPGVLPRSRYLFPQMSGDNADAVACAGTVAIRLNSAGSVQLLGRTEHQSAIDRRVVPFPGCPHCR